MTRFTRLAWTAATFTYLLIILGAIVRITGSGMGCGEHWPLCNGTLLPPLDVPTLIEYGHRLAAAGVSVVVVVLAGYTWLLRRRAGAGSRERDASHGPPDLYRPLPTSTDLYRPGVTAYVAVALLVIQVVLGAVTVKLSLPPWTVILHLGTAMLLLATLLVIAKRTGLTPGTPGTRGLRPGPILMIALALGFVTVLFGALTANLGAASACLGFPLCNGHVIPAGNYLQHIQWTHRLLAYFLAGYVVWWAIRENRRGVWYVVALVSLQVVVAAAMVLLGLPQALRAVHVAVGASVWAALVLVVL